MVRHNEEKEKKRKEKELYTGEGCVEMDIPWPLCRTIGPLTLHSQEMEGAGGMEEGSGQIEGQRDRQHYKYIFITVLLTGQRGRQINEWMGRERHWRKGRVRSEWID